MCQGMTGRLEELSDFLKPDNGWLCGREEGWEEQPYWLRGFYSLAVLTGNKDLLKKANRWIEAVISSQQEDGYFGPANLKNIKGKNGREMCDLWPHMVMFDALTTHYERTGDERVVSLMERFFDFCTALPEEKFIPRPDANFEIFGWKPYVQYDRAGDMLPHLYWLYNKTGQTGLLQLGTRFYQHLKPPEGEWLDYHVVNFTQRFRYPGNYYLQSCFPPHRKAPEYWYRQHLLTWGQQPGGIFGADERIRPGFTDPRQGFETCGLVEFNKSFYILGRITGETIYADRCEAITLNHFPAAQTPDLKALHYLTASNQPQLDAGEQHDYYNKGRQICYSPWIYRCCQHNVAMGWPYYAENLWQSSADKGLVAWLYAACEVTARVGREKAPVKIFEETAYPFSKEVKLTVESLQKIRFPIYLRVPNWCEHFSLSINDEPVSVQARPGFYLRVERNWTSGDRIVISMEMKPSLTIWPRTGSVTVNRGPLSYSLRIGERWQKCGGTEDWPEWEVFPTTPWNYALVVKDWDNLSWLRVEEAKTIPEQPWTVEASPVMIRATGRRLLGWKLEKETVPPLPTSPVSSCQPEEELTLIPSGCARLRISCFPVVDR